MPLSLLSPNITKLSVLITMGLRVGSPKICRFGISVILNWRYLRKIAGAGRILWPPPPRTCHLESRKQSSHVKGVHAVPVGRETPYTWDREFRAEKVVETKLLTTLTYYPSVNFFVKSSYIYYLFERYKKNLSTLVTSFVSHCYECLCTQN